MTSLAVAAAARFSKTSDMMAFAFFFSVSTARRIFSSAMAAFERFKKLGV